MSDWARMKKIAKKQLAEGLEGSREYLDDLRRETAPQRKRLGREAKRQAPKVAAFALATLSELVKGYGPKPSERPRRRPLGAILVAGVLVWLLVRALRPRRS